MTTTPLTEVSGFDTLLTDIRQRAGEFEAQRYISHDIIERFKTIGIYRAFVPERFGGDARTPMDFLSMVEAISAADGSAGWIASFGMNPFYLAALPEATIDEVWKETPDIVFAGGIFPTQAAKQTPTGNYTISGRWKYASGCMGASLLGVGIQPDVKGELPRMAVLPKDQVTIDENWDMIGMCGTGSHDLVIEQAEVSPEWTFIRGSKPTLDDPTFKYPSLSLATQVLAVTTLGLAREALDIVQAEAKARQSVTGAPNLGEREYAQIKVGKAEAKWRACKAFFYESTADAWDSIMAGDEPSPEQVNLLRLSSTHLTHECVDVVRTVYEVMGMTSAENSHPMTRIYRDAALCSQHAFMGDITLRNAGAMFFGHQPYPGYL